MDLKYQANAIRLVLNMLDGRTPTTGIIPYQPQNRAFEPAESVRLPRSSPERQGVESRRLEAFGRALREAVSIDEALGGEIPSTKGVLV